MAMGGRSSEKHRFTCLEDLLAKSAGLEKVSFEGTLELELLDIAQEDVVELA